MVSSNDKQVTMAVKYDYLMGANSETKNETTKRVIIDSMTKSSGASYRQFEEYVRNFGFFNEYKWHPSGPERLKTSGVRNLLMELDVIQYSSEGDYYYLLPEYISLFDSSRLFTPKEAKALSEQREELGKEAEKVVILYESDRLALFKLPGPISWTSQENVLSGYDISSYTVSSNKEISDRYIEVKAISKENLRFFWSRNEINAAIIHGDKYFLYLLPVVQTHQFDLNSLIIIQNPYQQVFKNLESWHRREEVIEFFKAKASNLESS